MPTSLRMLLILSSVLMMIYVTRKIRESQIRLGDARFWIALSVLFLLFSIFPGLVQWLCIWLKIQSPINLVFLIVVFLLIIKLFLASLKLSQTEERLNNLIQEVALRDMKYNENTKKLNENEIISGNKGRNKDPKKEYKC